MAKRLRGRVAWLVTWEWDGNHARVPNKEVIAAVLRPQIGAQKVRRYVEVLYAQREYAAIDKLYALDHPYPSRFGHCHVEPADSTHRPPSWDGEILCGDNPYLRARIVDNLRPRNPADPKKGLVWVERRRPVIRMP
jgi:hypothetical protein